MSEDLNRIVSTLAISLALAAPPTGAEEADLALTKTSDAVVGLVSDHTFTLHVENFGPDTASGVTVTDPLTSDVLFQSASPGCMYQSVGHTVTCTISDLVSGASQDIEILVTVAMFPAVAEVGVVLTATAPALAIPATAIVETRYNQHEVFASGDQLVTPRGIEGEAGPTVVVADVCDPSAEAGGAPIIDGRVIRVNRSTGSQFLLSSGGELLNPTGIAVDDAGRIFVADPTGPVLPEQLGRVIEIDPITGAQTVRGTGILFERPWGIEVLTSGDLIVADAVGKLVRLNPNNGGKTLVSEFGALSRPRAVAQLSPTAVVVADADSGLVRVDLNGGAQTVIMPIDGMNLCEPVDVEVDHDGHCWVADPSCGGSGEVHRINCNVGSVLTSYDDGLWSSPRGIGLLDIFSNRASVTSTTPDPDPSNNSDWVATEMEEGYEAAIEVVIDETVAVTDEVTIEVHTPVVIEVLESITIDDTVAAEPAVRIDVAELITVSDLPFTAPAVGITVTENITATDSVEFQGLFEIFIDGFESGDTSVWSSTIGGL